jgi:putative heme-binding domain-containing protein
VTALEKSPGTDALTAEDLDRLLAGFPANVPEAAQPLRQRLATRQAEQAEHLTGLLLELLQHPGSADRGREAFFSKKVGCFVCHRAGNQGGSIGPDLSQVGRFRTARDLLEAIVYPSSTVVPHFRSYTVQTKDGRAETGLIVRESAEAVYLRTPQLAEVRVASADVEEIAPAKLSLMPEGLEKTMTRQDLSDLLEFLYQQR